MTNKKKIKNAIEQDINPNSYYNEIIRTIEKGAKMKNKSNIWKWSFVPICLVVAISGILLINDNKELNPNIFKPNIETKETIYCVENSVMVK